MPDVPFSNILFVIFQHLNLSISKQSNTNKSMKKILSLLFLCLMTLSAIAQKQAILVVQFGTSNDEGRAAALDVLFSDVKEHCPQYEVREAYTSPTIRRILARKGVKKDSAVDALLRLHLDGYETVYVMPTFLLDGVEMNMLRDDVRSVQQFFKEVKVGTPVLYRLDDFHAVADILTQKAPAKGEAVMFVGHGNEYASTGAYTMLSQIMQQHGNFFVGTIEGWPDLDASVAMVNPKKFKSVSVIPMLVAAGVHVREDVDGEWRPAFEKKGFKVNVSFHGLGEDKAFRSIILQHLDDLLKSE